SRLLLGSPDQHFLPDLLLLLSSVLLIHVRTTSASSYSAYSVYFSVFTWLNHERAPSKLSIYREFVFMLQGNVYLRYNPFATPDDFKK
ncbi:hypothetical protein BD309DRAFT_862765, partial [Dichomitus squalens]